MSGLNNLLICGVLCAIAMVTNLYLSFKYMKTVRPGVSFYIAFGGIYLCFTAISAASMCNADCLTSVIVSITGIAISVPVLYVRMVQQGKGYPGTMSTAMSLLVVVVAILAFANSFVANWEGTKGALTFINLVGFFYLVGIMGVVSGRRKEERK